jgi:hypothetical protein
MAELVTAQQRAVLVVSTVGLPPTGTPGEIEVSLDESYSGWRLRW